MLLVGLNGTGNAVILHPRESYSGLSRGFAKTERDERRNTPPLMSDEA